MIAAVAPACLPITARPELRAAFWNSLPEAGSRVCDLFSSDPANPFLNPAWLDRYWRATRRNGENCAVIGIFDRSADPGVPVAAAAFRYTRSLGTLAIRFLGEGRSDYNSIAGSQSPEALTAMLAALRDFGRPAAVRFADVPSGSPLAVFLALQPGVIATPLYACPFRDLSPTGEAASGSKNKFVARIPSYIRRLQVFGNVELEVLDFDADRETCLASLPGLFALHDLRHRDRRNSWKDESNRAFLCQYLALAERTNMLGFVTRLDGIPVAFDLGFRAGRTFVLYIPAFHPAFAKFRLGHINRHLTFQRCASLGIDRYDFSRGDSFAKRVWSTGERFNFEFCLPLHGDVRSRSAAALLSAKGRAKAFLRRRDWHRRAGELVEKIKLSRAAAPSHEPVGEAAWTGAHPLRYSLVAGLDETRLTRLADEMFERNLRQSPMAEWTANGTLRILSADAAVVWTV